MSGQEHPAVIATDLDGTLVRTDGSVSTRTRRALQAVDEAGIDVVFVTARPPRWLPALSDAVARHGHVICLGGACVMDLGNGTCTLIQGFDDGVLHEVITDLRAAIPGVRLAVERVTGPVYDPGFHHELDQRDIQATADSGALIVIAPVESSFNLASHQLPDAGAQAGRASSPFGIPSRAGGPTGPVAKLLARCPHLGSPDVHAMVMDVVGHRATLADSGAHGLAELLPPGVTKGGTLATWCERKGVGPEHVWAFGDMPNDLPMLTWARRSFAVANAHQDVLRAVTDITTSNDDDGVAQALETLLSGR